MTPTIHTLDEAAAILRVKPSWLERQAAARKIPFTMLGGSYHFTSEHLTAIVAMHENQPVRASHSESRPALRRSGDIPRSNGLQARPLRPRPLSGPRRAA
jgi:excisionase family DNA binding protein